MNKYRASMNNDGDVIEADFIEVWNGAICFYIEKMGYKAELIAVRPLTYRVTKEA